MPPQNPVDRTIVDVSALGIKLTYLMLRLLYALFCRLWPDWQNALILVKSETVIGWHRKGFELFWTWKSRNKGGRRRIDAEIRTLIRRVASENPTSGAPRIHGELVKLAFEVGAF